MATPFFHVRSPFLRHERGMLECLKRGRAQKLRFNPFYKYCFTIFFAKENMKDDEVIV